MPGGCAHGVPLPHHLHSAQCAQTFRPSFGKRNGAEMLDTDVVMAMYRQVLKDPEWLQVTASSMCFCKLLRQVKWIIRADPQCVFSTPNLRSLLAKEAFRSLSRGTFGFQEMEAATTPTYLVAEDPGIGFPKFFQALTELKSVAKTAGDEPKRPAAHGRAQPRMLLEDAL